MSFKIDLRSAAIYQRVQLLTTKIGLVFVIGQALQTSLGKIFSGKKWTWVLCESFWKGLKLLNESGVSFIRILFKPRNKLSNQAWWETFLIWQKVLDSLIESSIVIWSTKLWLQRTRNTEHQRFVQTNARSKWSHVFKIKSTVLPLYINVLATQNAETSVILSHLATNRGSWTRIGNMKLLDRPQIEYLIEFWPEFQHGLDPPRVHDDEVTATNRTSGLLIAHSRVNYLLK